MSTNITPENKVRQLDRRAEPDEQVTEEDVKDPPRMVRLLMRILRDIATLKRRWAPRRIDFEGIVANGTHRLEHGFGGPVRWWVVEWDGAAAAHFYKDTSSTNDTLALVSTVAGNAIIRVEESG